MRGPSRLESLPSWAVVTYNYPYGRFIATSNVGTKVNVHRRLSPYRYGRGCRDVDMHVSEFIGTRVDTMLKRIVRFIDCATIYKLLLVVGIPRLCCAFYRRD